MTESENNRVLFTPKDKDNDLVVGLDIIKLKQTNVDPIGKRVTLNETFNTHNQKSATKNIDKYSENIEQHWIKYKKFCMATFQTKTQDFYSNIHSELYSKKVRDRLAEFSLSSEEAKEIIDMQLNEERLREYIGKRSKLIEPLNKEGKYWNIIEIISELCRVLDNKKSPQFYPAQFMLVIECIEHFAQVIYERINMHDSIKDYASASVGSKESLAINWLTVINKTTLLLPRTLLQIAYLRSIKFHPYRNSSDLIVFLGNVLDGIGHTLSGVYARTFFLYFVYKLFPDMSNELIIPTIMGYIRSLKHLQDVAFHRQFGLLKDYKFSKYIETHRPAVNFLVLFLVLYGDANLSKKMIDEFYAEGFISSFVLSCFLDGMSSSFLAQNYRVFLHLIEKSDDVIPKNELIRSYIVTTCKSETIPNVIDVMNEVWSFANSFEDVNQFMSISSPFTTFIVNFCPYHYIEIFLSKVIQMLRQNFSVRDDWITKSSRQVTSSLIKSIKESIFKTIDVSKDFSQVLSHVPSVITLFDFLDQAALTEVSDYILNSVRNKPFPLNDPLTIRILLELSQVLFQSANILSSNDSHKDIERLIEWFLYRVDFRSDIETHLNFLLQARNIFQKSSYLLGVISKIALRLIALAHSLNLSNFNIICHSLVSFAFVTVPSMTDLTDCCSLFIQTANVALIYGFTEMFDSGFDEFLKISVNIPPSKKLFELFLTGLSLLLVAPSKPSSLPFYTFKKIIHTFHQIKWTDDEKCVFALEAICIVSHSLRSQFVYKIENIDSNDLIFAGNQEYRDEGLLLLSETMKLFSFYFKEYKKKGVVVSKNKAPTLALKAISLLSDLLVSDERLISYLSDLSEIAAIPESPYKETVTMHLSNVLGREEPGKTFLSKYFNLS